MSNTTWQPLEEYGFIDVCGEEASKLLQGQVTCDISQLSNSISCIGSHCNPKGRMIYSFRIAALGDNHFRLRLHCSILEKAKNTLEKYAVFSKATVSTPEVKAFGIEGKGALELANKLLTSKLDSASAVAAETDFVAIQLDESGLHIEFWVETAAASAFAEKLTKHCQEADSLDSWFLGQIQRGIGEVREETSEMFIPQMLNFQLVGGISFTKGCYTGQEVVARTKYLGKLKRHMYRAITDAKESLSPGTPLFTAEKPQSIGNVVFSATADEKRQELLAVITADIVDSHATIRAGEEGPVLNILALPYPLVED